MWSEKATATSIRVLQYRKVSSIMLVFMHLPLLPDDALTLFDSDLHELGKCADAERCKRHSNKAYYVVNAHINPTNICRIGCPLCAFAAKPGEKKAYVLEIDDILRRAERAVEWGATQIHLVSSVHPDKPYAWYREILRILHQTFPQIWLKAWTAVEIAAFAQSTGKSYEFILSDLQSVGLTSLPGGGAEIFDAEVRQKIAPNKIPAEVWLEVHRTAHTLKIPTNATMLFGHGETPAHRIEHLLKLRELQDETGGFDCFVPLVFHPKNTQIDVLPISPQEILKTIAVCRLVLHNIEHIKAYWITLGESLAQIALSYGADDFDGTVFEERIHHDAGSLAPSGVSEARLRELIFGAGREPVKVPLCAGVPAQ
jgi:aminodeoxyfutalosine synthase